MYRTILVPLDGSPFSERALPLAADLARATDADVLLVRATGDRGEFGANTPEVQGQAVEEAEAYLADIAKRLGTQGLQAEVSVSPLQPSDGILLESQLHRADLVVMCTHGRSGVGRWHYGSVAEGVLAHSPVPVLLTRPTDTPVQLAARGAAVLAPLDGSAFGEAVLPYAAALAQALDATLVLVRVIQLTPVYSDQMTSSAYVIQEMLDGDEAEAEKYLAQMSGALTAACPAGSEMPGLRVRTCTRIGSPVEVILEESKAAGAQLIAMATHGRTGLRQLIMGSVAHEVLRRGSLPLLLVRPGGTVS